MIRAWVDDTISHTSVADNAHIEQARRGPYDGDLILPAAKVPSRLIIFYHGGGIFFCSSRAHRVTASNLAGTAGCTVLAPDYRPAPENPASAAHDAASGAYKRALEEGYAPGEITLRGESSGGALSLDKALL